MFFGEVSNPFFEIDFSKNLVFLLFRAYLLIGVSYDSNFFLSAQRYDPGAPLDTLNIVIEWVENFLERFEKHIYLEK